MRKYLKIFWSVFCSFTICCEASEQQKSKPYFLTKGLVIMVPQDVTVKHQIPAEDFETFTFKKPPGFLVGMYLGNFPEFPKEKSSGKPETGTLNGLTIESVVVRQKDGTVSREVLFHINEINGWPQRLHCWYQGLGPSEFIEAGKLISTVHRLGSTNSNIPSQPVK